jgi:hypothetical protein
VCPCPIPLASAAAAEEAAGLPRRFPYRDHVGERGHNLAHEGSMVQAGAAGRRSRRPILMSQLNVLLGGL